MSVPRLPDDVKLICSLFSPEKGLLDLVITELEGVFGPIDWKSPEFIFDRTRYYEREMGGPLYRYFVAFERLIRPDDLVEIKLETNGMEMRHQRDGRRMVNIDPGYICLERLILATGKNYTHRVYLSKGIYADLTLVYHKGGFRSLPWTYRDYADSEIIGYLNSLREGYKRRLRGIDKDVTEGDQNG
jgi:hypothetical protein